MSEHLPNTVPSGWYPDPSGAPQWRVWTGSRWSELTKPYGPRPAGEEVLPTLRSIQAVHRVLRYGIVGFLGGFGVLVGTLGHLPHSAHPAPTSFYWVASALALALVLFGSLALGVAVSALNGKLTPVALVPGLNFLAFSALATKRLGGKPGRRIASEALLLLIFATQLRHSPLYCLVLGMVALDQMRWTRVLLEKLDHAATSRGPQAL